MKVATADLADAVVGLTRQLVAFDSVNPGLMQGAEGEGPIAQFVADRLSGSGFEVQLVPVPSERVGDDRQCDGNHRCGLVWCVSADHVDYRRGHGACRRSSNRSPEWMPIRRTVAACSALP
jgi:acetylornithine deacetylase/succinyl-diaminopimelate desuccinylase-like protein